MPDQFDVRVRKLHDQWVRCLLLPHRTGAAPVPGELPEDLPWSLAPVDATRTPDPGAGGTQPSGPDDGLWLPPMGTVLKATGLTRIGSAAKLRRITLNAASGSIAPAVENRNGGFTDGTVRCFGGVEEAIKAAEGQRKLDLQSAVFSCRDSKEFLLCLIEAFRFRDSLEEYGRIAEAELMACLSHLVFDVDLAGTPEAERVPEKAWWDKTSVVVTHPASLDGERLQVTLPADNALPAVMPLSESDTRSVDIDRSPVPLRVVQRADGVYFKLLLNNVEVTAPDELKVLLRRSEGDVPLPDAAVVQSAYFDVKDFTAAGSGGAVPLGKTWDVVDRLAPEAFIGQQLHYRVELIDGFGREVAYSAVTLLRERFDPPPVPGDAEAAVRISDDAARATLVVTAVYATGLTREQAVARAGEMQEAYAAEFYYQERPLDECGFYGDDDDLALLEGLRQADANYDPAAVRQSDEKSPVPNHPLEDYLRGRYDREGLTQIAGDLKAEFKAVEATGDTAPQGEAKPKWRVVLEWKRPLAEAPWFREHFGYHLYVGLRRDDVANRHVRSSLSFCRHTLAVGDGATRQGVFQLERVPPAMLVGTPPVRLLNQQFFDLRLLDRQHDGDSPGGIKLDPTRPEDLRQAPEKDGDATPPTTGVRLVYVHPAYRHADFEDAAVSVSRNAPFLTRAAEAEVPIGGVRVLVRDQVAENQRMPFRAAEVIQALPRIVSYYRPIRLDSKAELLHVPTPEAAVPAAGTFSAAKVTLSADAYGTPAELDAGLLAFAPFGIIDTLMSELRAVLPSLTTARERRTASGAGLAGGTGDSEQEFRDLHRRLTKPLPGDTPDDVKQRLSAEWAVIAHYIKER